MSFAQDNGYIPSSITDLMALVRAGVNEQFGTDYDSETFAGTNFYKYFYALIQRLQENEIKASEIVLKLQQYFDVTNEEIVRPNTTNPGLIDYLAAAGFVASVKAPVDADAGKVFVCVDLDDGDHAAGIVTITSYANLVSGTDDVVTVAGVAFTAQVGAAVLGAGTFQAATDNATTAASLAAQINGHAVASLSVRAHADGAVVSIRAVHGGTAGNAIALAYTDNDANVGATKSGTVLSGGTDRAEYEAERLEVCEIIKACVPAGIISQGSEVETITLSNLQSFDFKFNLPDPTPVLLRLTIVISDNSAAVVPSDEVIQQTLFDNIVARYKLGLDFEPMRYFSVIDAPYAASLVLEYSDDNGSSWEDAVFEAAYDDLLTFELADISLVIS